MEVLELEDHPYFAAAQFHPEFLSRPLKAGPMFVGLILASCGKLQPWLKKGTAARASDRPLSPTPVGKSPQSPLAASAEATEHAKDVFVKGAPYSTFQAMSSTKFDSAASPTSTKIAYA
jgi:hypothetical protein